MQLGMNLAGLAYYANTRAFSNLLAGGTWSLINAQGQTVGSMPADRFDANKNVVTLAAREYAVRPFSIPTAAYKGASVDIVCRWEGKGTVTLFGDVIKNVRNGTRTVSFTFVPNGLNNGQLRTTNIDPADPLRSMDCREKDADPNALFDPTFLENVKRYSTLRFVKWMRSVEANGTVRWATRTKPGDGVIDGSDTVPVEYMVALANQTKTNPWFNMPWNADEDYIRRFATYVRDNLDPGLKVYVEQSNEVWNYVYPVAQQAIKEMRADGWTGDEYQGLARYYGKRSGQVLDIWAGIYAGQMSRLVRVAATQNSPWLAGEVLRPGDNYKKFDALATAPYFNATLKAGQVPASNDGWFYTQLQTTLDTVLGEAKKNKAVAAQYNLRYVTYEAGQHVSSPDDLAQQARIQRDPRMGSLYTRYLTKWRDEIGDLTILFADYGRVDKYGAWGTMEYPGQSFAEAPKANAVELFRQSYLR